MLIQAGREDPATGLSEEDLQVIEREIRRLEALAADLPRFCPAARAWSAGSKTWSA